MKTSLNSFALRFKVLSISEPETCFVPPFSAERQHCICNMLLCASVQEHRFAAIDPVYFPLKNSMSQPA